MDVSAKYKSNETKFSLKRIEDKKFILLCISHYNFEHKTSDYG